MTSKRYIEFLTGDANAPVEFQVFHDAEKGPGGARRYGTLDECHSWLLDAQRRGCGVFVAINATDGKGRRKENVTAARVVFLDLDGAPLPAEWSCEPDLIVNTSPGKYHVYWRIEETTDFGRWQMFQRALAARYGGDPKCIMTTQVARLAGFQHLKNLDTPQPVEIVHDSEARGAALALDDLADWFGFDLTPRPAAATTDPPSRGQDCEIDVERARAFLAERSNWKDTSDGAVSCYDAAVHMHDLGISEGLAVELLTEYVPALPPNAGPNHIQVKVRNAYRYAIGAAGSASVADDFEEDEEEDTEAIEKRRAKKKRKKVRDALAEWVWVSGACTFVRRSDKLLWGKTPWQTHFADLSPKKDIFNLVMRTPGAIQKMERLVFEPGQPEEIGATAYNLWRAPTLRAVKGNDPKWFIDHIAYLIPDSQEAEYLLDYLALLVQPPHVKIQFALLLVGADGTGKTVVYEAMKRILGEENVATPSNEEVLGIWTTWQEGKQLAIINDLLAEGKREVVNRLKPVITDMSLRIKTHYRPHYDTPNRLNIVANANDPDTLPIGGKDRRWLILKCVDKRNEEEGYYQRLWGHVRNDASMIGLRDWLLARKVRLNHNEPPPVTTMKREMIESAQDDITLHLQAMWDEWEHPFVHDLIRLEDVAGYVRDKFRAARNVTKRCSLFLRDHGATRYDPPKAGKRYRIWAIRNHSKWDAMTNGERVAAYEQQWDSTTGISV